jgi:hypothetical protein
VRDDGLGRAGFLPGLVNGHSYGATRLQRLVDIGFLGVTDHDALQWRTVRLAEANLERRDDRVDQVGHAEILEVALILKSPWDFYVAHDHTKVRVPSVLEVVRQLPGKGRRFELAGTHSARLADAASASGCARIRLRAVEQLEREYESWRHRQQLTFSDDDREQILALAEDLPCVWSAETTTAAVELNRGRCHPARGECITSNVTLGSPRMSELRGKIEVNHEFPRQTRAAGPGRAALQSSSTRRAPVILDEFVAVTGYDRKYAIRSLLGPIRPPASIRRPRAAQYGIEVQQAPATAWSAANGICAKRLVPFLPELIPTLERHGHLSLTDEVREQLLALSSATADRLLRPLRHPHGLTATKPGRLLKKQIPIRTFTEWNDVKPGFLEADLVAHCGGNLEGAFLYSLTLTDVATTWTECLPLLHRTQHGVVHALQRARSMFPFPLLGIDTDNGSEFINEELLAYCAGERLTFTRGRVANKNDACYVEQKNGSVVRQLVGYDRFEGERAYRQLAELYRAVRLYVFLSAVDTRESI